jgi:hypothetical protein
MDCHYMMIKAPITSHHHIDNLQVATQDSVTTIVAWQVQQ